MISTLQLLVLLAAPALPPDGPTAASAAPAASRQSDEEYDRRRKEAGDDVGKLWELYLWCDAFGKEKEGRSTLRRIVKLDPEHKDAREKLGHIHYDGKWFTTQKKLDEYKRDEEKRIAKEKGLVRHEGEWVPAEDVPYLERGLVRDEEGRWVSAEEYEKLKAGWVRQDLVWVSPEEVENVSKGLWKCGDKWLSQEDADRYHSRLGRWWVIPSDHYVVYSTCDREVVVRAIDEMERAYVEFARATGRKPESPVAVVLLRGAEQYGAFAAGSEAEGRAPTEGQGFSSLHYAYFAELWFEEGSFMGAGVAYWDASSDAGNAFGRHAARHAAGQSYMEAIDPSPKALKAAAGGGTERFLDDFWEEKQLPTWFRYGAAAYGERYFIDSLVAAGGNPNWAREWSVQNLLSRGGLRKLEDLFEFELSIDDPRDSERMINESGLLVAFMLDGSCTPVVEKHAALKEALKEGKSLDKAFKALEKELAKHDAELRKFAGI